MHEPSQESSQHPALTAVESPVSNDLCPDWAHALLARLLVLEIETGTIQNPTSLDENASWSSASLEQLTKASAKLDREDLSDLSLEIEAIFTRLARGLASVGFSNEAIAAMINTRIPTGCRLPYCNAEEIAQAILQ
jgi:hypothetical protein